MFKKFNHIPGYTYDSGWDKYALDYQKLLVEDTVYFLTKEIIHEILDSNLPKKQSSDFHVLDVNCGTGNDFPFFFKTGWKVTGCDGSIGMLNKAAEKYSSQLSDGTLNLYSGMIENIQINDFEKQRFDVIFSVTGGFSYINDSQLYAINEILSKMLKPGGFIVLAHLNRFCFPESFYRLAHIRNPILRKGKSMSINIRGESFTMHFRGPSELKNIYTKSFKQIIAYPLLALTPPYQTGFKPSPGLLRLLRKIEFKAIHWPRLASFSDQVVIFGKK